jgi:hypothetical protein
MLGLAVGDPTEFKVIVHFLLNDQIGTFVDTSTRFPVRFFSLELKELQDSELELVRDRVVQFIQRWIHLAEAPPPTDPLLKDLLADPFDVKEVFNFLRDPPRGFIPDCEYSS